MNSRFLVFLVAILAFGCTAPAMAESTESTPDQSTGREADHLLRYKFVTGEVVRYAVAHAANIRTTIEGTTQAAKTSSHSTKAWKIIDVTPEGEIEFAHVVEDIRMENELPDRAVAKYDSKIDASPPPGFEQAAAAVGVTLTVVRMGPNGKVNAREEKHAQPGNSEDAPMAVPLPEDAVAIGAEWNEPHFVNVELPDNERRRIETRRHFKLVGVNNGLAKIEVSYQVLSPIDARIESQLVQRLASGVINFDIDRGRVDSQQLDVDKRIVGFAGPSSSMHYLSRFTEKLLDDEPGVATTKGPDIAQ